MAAKRVYLIESEGRYKIGFSDNPERRCQSLRLRGKPRRLVHSFPCGECRLVERRLHAHFTDKRLKGEWFALSAEDVAVVCSIQTCPGVDSLPETIRQSPIHAAKRWGRSDDDFQVNIRLSTEEAAELKALTEDIHKATGLKLQQADVFRLGLVEWRTRYPVGGPTLVPAIPAPAGPSVSPEKRGRPRKPKEKS